MPLDMATETDSGDYAVTLDRCLQEFGWAEKAKLQGKLIDGRYHGIAVGCYLEGGASGPRENARLALEDDGTSRRSIVGSSVSGRASRPCLRRSPPTRSTCRWSASRACSTARPIIVSEGFGSYSSRSVVMGGSAIVDAAESCATRSARPPRKRLGCAAAEVDIDQRHGSRARPSVGRCWRSLRGGISADGTFASNKRTYSYGAHAAHVAVDPEDRPCRGASTTWRSRTSAASSIR